MEKVVFKIKLNYNIIFKINYKEEYFLYIDIIYFYLLK